MAWNWVMGTSQRDGGHAESAGRVRRGLGGVGPVWCGSGMSAQVGVCLRRAVGRRLASGDVELVGGTSESGRAHPDRVGPV